MSTDIGDQLRDLIGAKALNEYERAVATVVFEGAAHAAGLTTALTGNNNDLDFTAEEQGDAGNGITVQYVDPGVLGQALSVVVNGDAIVVNLATGNGTNEQQTITVYGGGGTFVVGFRDKTSGSIPYGASAAVVQAALESMSTIGAGNVSVSGSAGGPYTVTFQGALAGLNVGQLTGDGNGLTAYGSPTITHATTQAGDVSHNEIQTITFAHAARGKFSLTFSGHTTSLLHFGCSADTVAAALAALSNIGTGNVAVTKAGHVYTVTFQGTLGDTNVAQLTSTNQLRGSGEVVVATTVPGVAYAITTTSAQIITAIQASNPADALVAVANHSGNDGSGVVTAMAATPLTGGLTGTGAVGAQAVVSTNLANATNNDLDFTAVPVGEQGNGITIKYVDPGGTTATLGVVVDVQERAITVNLGRAASAINTTGGAIITAIAANAQAAALVVATNHSGNDGTGLVAAQSVLTLGGGTAGAHGPIALFNVSGEVTAALVLVCTATLVGSSAALKGGTETTSDILIPSFTSTSLTKGLIADKSGVVAAHAVPNTTPFQALIDGDVVELTPATAATTAGAVTAVLFYQKLGVDARVTAA